MIDDGAVRLLRASHNVVELQVLAVVLGYLEPVHRRVLLQANLSHHEEHTVHELHLPLKLRERLIQQVPVFLLKHAHGHNRR